MGIISEKKYNQKKVKKLNPQVFLVDIEQVTTTKSDGDPLWHVVIYTSGLDSEGENFDPVYINEYSADIDDLDELISEKITEICGQIDWTTSWYGGTYEQGEDTTPPQVAWQYPVDGQTDVPIGSSISVRLIELLPSKGIDLSSISMNINGITVSPSIYGNKYDCVATFKPAVSDS